MQRLLEQADISQHRKETRPPVPPIPVEWIGRDITFASNVPGVEEIGSISIPYARLPARAASAYRPRYTQWTDLADEVMEDLMALPGAGERTLRAVIAAAVDTVAAHRAARARRRRSALTEAHILLDRLDPVDRTMLTRLVFSVDPIPREHAALIADELGVVPAWFERHRPRAKRRFAEMLAEPAHSDVVRHADALRAALGPYTPSQRVFHYLRELRLDPGSVEAQMYLYAAGPYTSRGDWYENRGLGGERAMLDIVDRAFEKSPVQTDQALTASLVDAGMPAPVVPTFLATFFNLRRLNEVWVQWDTTSREQAEAILHAMGKPMTGADIHALTDSRPLTLDTLMRTLSTDERFVRASRTTWALRAWGVDEYRSVADEIGRRIDAAGGIVRTADVVSDILTTLPDVAESTVRVYLASLAFVVENGTVRRRRDDDPLPTQPHWNTARGTFKHGNTIRLALPVTGEMMRGSGLAILAAAAAGVGVHPGQRRSFATANREVTVAWPLESPNGPNIGSVRALAKSHDAQIGDTLVLIFDTTKATLTTRRIPVGTADEPLLQLLFGLKKVTLGSVAKGLDCPPKDVLELLSRRGDTALADIVNRVGIAKAKA